MVACHDQVRKGGLEGGSVKYLIVAEAYRDLEQASGRLVLIERMAELVTQTPAELLPTVCYLCQGQIAPSSPGSTWGWPRRWPSGRSPPPPAPRPRRSRST